MVKEQAITQFRRLTALAAAGARGRTLPDKYTGANWDAVACMAAQQNVLSLLGSALLRDPELDCPVQLRDQIQNHTRMTAAQNQIRQGRILALVHKMEASGIAVQLIKGYAVAQAYAHPECRQSEDTDLLIPPEQEEAAYALLRQEGFRVDRRLPTSHHAVCQHPKLGMVELHVQLYDALIEQGWLRYADRDVFPGNDPYFIATPEGVLNTLDPSDHAVFLAIHMVKHFIGASMNLRMMIDLGLFLSANRREIDFERLWRILNQIRFSGVVNCVLSLLVQTGCFGWESFPGAEEMTPETVDGFLWDLVQSARLSQTGQLENLYYEYSCHVMRKRMGYLEYKWYMLRWTLRNLLAQLWPEKDQLYSMYQVNGKGLWLLPVLRIRHILTVPIQKCRAGITPGRLFGETNSTEDSERLALFGQLDML